MRQIQTSQYRIQACLCLVHPPSPIPTFNIAHLPVLPCLRVFVHVLPAGSKTFPVLFIWLLLWPSICTSFTKYSQPYPRHPELSLPLGTRGTWCWGYWPGDDRAAWLKAWTPSQQASAWDLVLTFTSWEDLNKAPNPKAHYSQWQWGK